MNDISFHILSMAIFGGVAATGFAVLFNVGVRALPWCASLGAVALAVRTTGMEAGSSLELASFMAALTASLCTVLAARIAGRQPDTALALTGCIPLVPGAYFTKTMLGVFALSAAPANGIDPALVTVLTSMIHVILTLAGIGAGLVIPVYMLEKKAGLAPRRS